MIGGWCEVTQKINIQRTQNPKTRPDEKNLGFGRYFTDHMFIMDYNVERAGMIAHSPLRAVVAGALHHDIPLRSGNFRRSEGIQSG